MKGSLLHACFGLLSISSALGSLAVHGGCAHGHAAVAPGQHKAKDQDHFKELRGKICSGYIVFRQDTLTGIIVCSDDNICIKATTGQDSTFTFTMNDTNLSAISMAESNRMLLMTRLPDKKLYRILHSGRLSIYDTYFSFDHFSKEFFNSDSRILSEGSSVRLNSFPTLSVKRKLIACINKTYGLDMKPGAYNKKQLLARVATLE